MRHDMTMEAIRISQARAALGEFGAPPAEAKTAATRPQGRQRDGDAGDRGPRGPQRIGGVDLGVADHLPGVPEMVRVGGSGFWSIARSGSGLRNECMWPSQTGLPLSGVKLVR